LKIVSRILLNKLHTFNNNGTFVRRKMIVYLEISKNRRPILLYEHIFQLRTKKRKPSTL